MIKNYFKLIVALVFASNVMAQNVPSYVPTNGLVGYWPFNGNANDESGNGNNGTVNGATLTSDRNGKVNSAYDFDGKSYVLVDNINEKLQIEGDFSFSIWANIDVQEGNTQSLLVKGNNSTNEYSLQSYGDKTLHFDRQGLQTLSNFSYGQF
jgi:hypothetical protein